MSKFASNVVKLISGNVIAQLIGILLVPVVTRMYSPADFGIFQLFYSITTLLTVISCLAYQMAIMLPKEDEDAAAIVVLCVIILTITSVTSGLLCIVFSDWIGKALNAPEISQYFVFLPVTIFLSEMLIVLGFWASRKKQFGVYATSQVVNVLSGKCTQIVIGLFSRTPLGLIAGLVVGNISSFVVFLRLAKQDISLFTAVTKDKIVLLAKRYKRFPLFTTWSSLANSFSTQLAPLILVFFFSPTVVGYYALASIVVFMPMGLIGYATGQVFFQKACEEKNRINSVTNIVQEVHQRLLSIGMFPMFILMIIGTDLFTFFLGSQWFIAGEYAGILAPWQLIAFFTTPLMMIFTVLEKQHVDMTFNILILVCRTGALVIGGIIGDPVVAVMLFSGTGVIFFGSMNLYILKISGIPYMSAFREYLKYFSLCFFLVLPLIAVKLLLMPVYVLFGVTGIVSCIYYMVVISNDPVLKSEALGILQNFRR